MNRSILQGKQLAVAGFIAAAIIYIVLAIGWLDHTVPEKDGQQNAVNAYHLATSGVFSDDQQDSATPQPGYHREPFYPYTMALALRLVPDNELKTHGIGCVMDPSPDACPHTRLMLKIPNIVSTIALIAAIGFALWLMTGSGALSGGIMLFMALDTTFILYTNIYYSEPLASLLLFIHAFALYQAMKSEIRFRYGWAVASGLAYGLLVLVKAVFLHVLLLMAVVGTIAILVRFSHRNNRIITAFLLMIFTAACVVAPWMARNHAIGAGWKIAGRSAEILSLRASYDAMPWSDVPYAALQFTPIISSKIKKHIMGDEVYQRFSRKSPTGYYRLARRKHAPQDILAEEKDITLKKASFEVILDNIGKHLVLTPIFAYSQSFPPTDSNSHGKTIFSRISSIVCLAYVPLFTLFLIQAFRQRRLDYMALGLAVTLSFGLHAFLTHAIPRYGVPYVPVYVLAGAVYLYDRYKAKSLLKEQHG